MTLPGWIAAIILLIQLPIPLYWLVLHPGTDFWRTRQKAAYLTGVLVSWPSVTVALFAFRGELFRRDWPPLWQFVLGIPLIVSEMWIFWRVKIDLGTARLVGATELSGGGKVADVGIYARIRHPRYVGSFLSIIGACLIAGTRVMWIVAAAWALLMRAAIALEERELRARFGTAYEQYCHSVPRFVPHIRVARKF